MIYIVIPVYNRLSYTRNCLLSIENQTIRDFKAVVVDDGSTDGTAKALEREFPDVHVIKGDGNLYWTAAINLGISYALEQGADYILTMNNDTTIPTDFLRNMLKSAHDHPDSIFGALEINSLTQKPHYGGEHLHWWTASSTELLEELPPAQQHGLQEVDLYPARGLFIPRSIFEKIGLFDQERLPHYLADYDFTLQAKKAGFKIYCNYEAPVYTYPEESGDYEIRKKKTVKNYFNHLFDIKGGGNLRNYTVYTLKNCPKMVVPVALLVGYLRRLVGFWVY